MGDQAGRLAVIEKATPAGARADELSFGQMLQRAQVLAKTSLVPKALQGNPEAIVLVGALGAELGIPFIASLSEIHVIEGRPSPSAQMRLALVRRAGHEVEFLESTEERAVIRGRRVERRNEPQGWVSVTWTMEQARRAGLTDRWVEQWTNTSSGKRYAEKFIVGDRDGIFTAEDRARLGLPLAVPAWAQKAMDAGEIKQKDNWVKYPADMLRARAASTLCRMAFSDVLSGLGVEPHTADELGVEVGHDVDEPPADEGQDDVVDGELVEPEEGEDPRPIDVSGLPDPAFQRPTNPPEVVGTIEPEEPGENGGTSVVGGSTAPPAPGPVPRLATGGIDWREVAKRHGVTLGKLHLKAREFAQARGVDPPAELKDLTDEQVEADVLDWLGAP